METLSLPARTTHIAQPSKAVYCDLIDGGASGRSLQQARRFLAEQLEHAAALESDLPREMDGLHDWMERGVEEVGNRYRAYLQARQDGGARQYFETKAHALYFLNAVAPTKLVDGAWLYGLLPHWRDGRFTSLITTYLEELGEGQPSKNHVVIYKKLLASQGNPNRDSLSDDHYTQGAIQLALANHAESFLPEIIGFNLGYEQLPLHLLITAYELKELGIDPYYFTLHITVDNADSGHAKQAVDSVFAALPKTGDAQDFWRRVQNGYKLNLLGANTEAAIESFDLEREMMTIFSRKGKIGQYAHSDYRRVAGRTVNDWLGEPEVELFVAAMENEGWFKRHQDPQNSRFWKLIEGEKAKMFGVFSPYEQQVIYDWIAGVADRESFARRTSAPQLSEQTKQTLRLANSEENAAMLRTDFNDEVRELETRLADTTSRDETMKSLIALMSPANHHTAAGLQATRLFNDIFN